MSASDALAKVKAKGLSEEEMVKSVVMSQREAAMIQVKLARASEGDSWYVCPGAQVQSAGLEVQLVERAERKVVKV